VQKRTEPALLGGAVEVISGYVSIYIYIYIIRIYIYKTHEHVVIGL
jgi:hypothetical protein